MQDAAPNQVFQVQSPGGFHGGDLVVGIATPGAPGSACESSKVPAVSVPDGNGIVTITHTATAVNYTTGSTLFNLAAADRAQRVRYSVKNGVLYSTPLLDANGQPLAVLVDNPLASNVLNLKIEYALDSVPDPPDGLDTRVQ